MKILSHDLANKLKDLPNVAVCVSVTYGNGKIVEQPFSTLQLVWPHPTHEQMRSLISTGKPSPQPYIVINGL